MIDVNKLRGRMAEKGRSGQDMAKVIGKTPKTFYSKMKAGVFDSDEIEAMVIKKTPKTFYAKMKKGVFDSDEIIAMVHDLDIENPGEIFFADEVTP